MLSKFFHAQYNFEVKHDWTATVRQDLIDFGIKVNLENIKSKSEFVFKKMVKLKAQEYELCKLNSMKGSKMENTFHGKLEIQKYLRQKNISAEDAKLVFAFRTRMAKFSENFRGPHGPKMCTLCYTHLDNQPMAFNCTVIKPYLDKKGKYEYIFRSEIPMETIRNLKIITKMREEI